MSKNLRIDLEIGLDKARAALKQLQQEANQIAKSSGGGGGGGSGSGSGGGSGGLLGGLGLNAASAAAGAAAAGIAAVGAELKMLASRAVELSQSASSATSQLGQLRSAVERSNISKDAAATSPGVINLAKAAADFQKEFADFIKAAGSTPAEQQKALGEKLAGGLGGDDKETWRRMKESRQDLEVDVARQRQALDTAQFRQNRDYALQIQQFNIQSSRQKADLDKENARTQFDYTVARTKFEEDQAGKMAQKSYDLSRQFAAQNFAISQGRATQDYQISKQDKSVDFNINKSRQLQDREDTLTDMELGGADALTYFRYNRDFAKQQQRQQEDYNLSNARDARNFNLNQGRATQDFSLQSQQASASRQLEIENHLYERKYESLQLETQHARALQDINTAYSRLAQDIGMGQTRLKNQGSDLAYDQAVANRDFGIDTGRKFRNSDYGFQDFAGAMRAKDPLAAAGQGAQDSTFAAALAKNAAATGQADLFQQVNSTVAAKGIGDKVGGIVKSLVTDVMNQTLDGLNPDKNPNALSLNPFDWFKSTAGLTKPDMNNPLDKAYQDELNGKGGRGAPAPDLFGGNSDKFNPVNFVGNTGPTTADTYMDGPARADAARQPVVISVGNNNLNVTAGDPQLEQKLNARWSEIFNKAVQEMTDLVRSQYNH